MRVNGAWWCTEIASISEVPVKRRVELVTRRALLDNQGVALVRRRAVLVKHVVLVKRKNSADLLGLGEERHDGVDGFQGNPERLER